MHHNIPRSRYKVGVCINGLINFAFKMMGFCIENAEFCIKIEILMEGWICVRVWIALPRDVSKNEEFCIQNQEVCIQKRGIVY